MHKRPQFPKDFKGPSVDHRYRLGIGNAARVQGDERKHLLGGSFTYPNGGFSHQDSVLSPVNCHHPITEFTTFIRQAMKQDLDASRNRAAARRRLIPLPRISLLIPKPVAVDRY